MQVTAQLAVEGPEVDGIVIDLVSEIVSLGRSEENLVVLPDPAISRRHARIDYDEGQFWLQDLGSLNGCVVNGIRLAAKQPFLLRAGDRIQIGPFTLHFSINRSAPRSGQTAVRIPVVGDIGPRGATRPGEPRITAAVVPPPTGPRDSAPRMLPDVAPPRLVVWNGTTTREYLLSTDITVIGRDADCDVVVDDPTVSRHHAEIRRTLAGFELVDLGSGNGIVHQGHRIRAKLLVDNDSFQIGDNVHLMYRDGTTIPPNEPASRPFEIGQHQIVSIGRDSTNEISLDHPQVSRRHARLERRLHGWHLFDLDSTNGTFVNGERVSQVLLGEGDSFQIGPFDFKIADGQIAASSAEGNIQVDAIGLVKTVGKGQTILDHVYLTIKPREFVAIVGSSGAGKTTLIDALSGFRPASRGQVLYNGHDLYHTFNAFRASIGYVPQDDIIHRELTVSRALGYAAMLRLPKDTTAAEREYRIEEVLTDLGLTEQRNTPVHRLSGGQRKRVSMGVELLTRPSLFFLDEPTSGLDPATETNIMRLLRELADQGRTLVLVTHATQNILLCDKVAIMSRGGRLAFFGSPQEALDFFQVQEFVDIYDMLERETPLGQYAGRYVSSPYHDRYLGQLKTRKTDTSQTAPRAPEPSHSGISSIRQFLVLTLRYIDIMFSNKRALAILLMQAPIIAILIGLVFPRTVFEERPTVIPTEVVQQSGVPVNPFAPIKACGLTDEGLNDLPPPLRIYATTEPCGDARKAMLMLFLVSVVAIWLGASNAAKEIVKELPVFRRERMVSLRILPYLFSKMTVLFLISAIQTVLLLAILFAMIAFPLRPGIVFGIILTTYLTFVTATMMGLLVSALVGSNDEAGNLVPVLLIPQIIFAGAMLSLGEMGSASKVIAQFVVSKWSWEVLGAIVDIPYYAREQGGAMLSLLEENKWNNTFDIVIWGHYLVLALFCLVFLIGASISLRRKNNL